MLNEISQTMKDKYSFTCGISKCQTQNQRTEQWLAGAKTGEWGFKVVVT